MSMGNRICLPKDPKWLSKVTIVKGLSLLNNMQRLTMVAGQWWESFLVSSLMLSPATSSSVSSDDWSNFHRNFGCVFRPSELFRTTTFWDLLMPDLIELLTYYVIVLLLFVGAPGVFFFIVFMPALQNTKGRMVGYKDHKTYGNSTIYEVNRTT